MKRACKAKFYSREKRKYIIESSTKLPRVQFDLGTKYFQMKKSIIAFCASALLLASCKEKAPYINLKGLNYVDSPYSLSSAPAADAHQVLVEEFTGQSCSNCPAAHVVLDGLEQKYEGKINVIGMYLYNIQQTEPPAGAAYDFRDNSATTVGNSIYGGISQLPNGGVDRVLVNGAIQVGSGLWNSAIDDRVNKISPVNIKISSHYSGNHSTIDVDLQYTAPVAVPQNLSVVIVEDSIVDKQEYPFFDPQFPSGMDDAYVFTNVFRQMVSSPAGDAILNGIANINPGMALRRTYTYDVASKIKDASKCRIIAFVSNNADKNQEIVQSVQARLK